MGFTRRFRSMVLTCSKSATEVVSSPAGSPFTMRTCVGERGTRTAEVIGATMVVPSHSFVMSFWMTSAGRVFLIS